MKNLFCLFCATLQLLYGPLFGRVYSDETPVLKYLKPIDVIEEKSGLDLVDCIYVVNLDERIEKWKDVKNLLDERGLHVNRYGAINGWQLPKEAFFELHGQYPVRCTGGQVGCLLSHVSILKDAIERGYECIWILEDDIEFLDDVQKIPPLILELAEYDPDWDILYTDIDFRDAKNGYIVSVSSNFRPDQTYFPLEHYTRKVPVSSNLVRIGQRFGTRSYIFSRKGMQKVYDYFTHVSLWTPIDIDLHYIPGIREYTTATDIVSNKRIRLYADTGPKSSLGSK